MSALKEAYLGSDHRKRRDVIAATHEQIDRVLRDRRPLAYSDIKPETLQYLTEWK